MSPFAKIAWILLALGLAGLTANGFWINHINHFIGSASVAQGKVIRLLPRQGDNGVTYRPQVEFTALDGQAHQFASNGSSNPPAYAIGETVTVLYPPEAPQDAHIDGVLDLWLGPIIVGGVTGTFALFGAIMLLVRARQQRRQAQVRLTGTRVDVPVQGVERNTSIRVNGRSPWRVVAQWRHPQTGLVHLFYSDNLWFDPSAYLAETIPVVLDRQNPKRYWMDLSSLPEMAA